jgi:CRISPR/Cas system-associated exonuclease Cas4 (RecB family)
MLLPSRDNSCTLKYAFRYRLGLPETPGLGLYCGKALDAGCNEMLAPALFGEPVDLMRGVKAMTDQMVQCPMSLGDIEAETKALERALMAFYNEHSDWKGESVQLRIEVDIDGLLPPLLGFIDRIDADGCVVDVKLTRSQKVSNGVLDADWLVERRHQLALYLAALNAQDGGNRTDAALEICYVSARLKAPQWRFERLSIDMAEQDREIEAARDASLIRDSGYCAPHPGRRCTFCDYTEPCARVLSTMALAIPAVAEAVA